MSKEQEKFNTQYSNEKEIVIFRSKSIFNFSKSEFTNLKGSLKIEGFKNLGKVSLKELKLTGLKINDCSQLNRFDLSELTKLTSLTVRDCPKLTPDDCSLIKLTSLKSLTISNCSRFNKIFNLSLFPKLESLSIIESSNLITFDCSPSGLTNLEISDCSQLNQITGFSKLPKLDSLSVINCPKLTKLNCSSIKTLIELEVSDLEELNCSNTSIEELSLNLCPNITKLTCLNNKKLNKLDLSNCSNLVDLNCTGSILTSVDLSYCPKSIKVEPSDLIITQKKENIRNILLVGRTGGGRSTNKGECETDMKKMREENELIAEIINSCNGVVHVDNPPINIIEEDDDDYKDRILFNKNARKKSRNKLLTYLEEKNMDEQFKSENWEVLCNEIIEYIRNNNLQELEIDPDILKLSEEACLIL
ncbi:hypothetical protein RhiirA5_450843 [Rhizophagus irregularis]|uniref:L domain-like protein n=1 Tax=Rhizophagus irregularis TaxID=588596 RepID=A0A2N0PA02_9GLOM|nr:hypothetical protein RhiirA5_450843 [Rhizophagus irregularis]